MKCKRLRCCTRHVILCSLGLALITLLPTGYHVIKPGNYYIHKFDTAFLTNVTLKNASQTGRAQLFRQTNYMQSITSAITIQNSTGSSSTYTISYHYDKNIGGNVSMHLIQTGLSRNNDSKALAERKQLNRSTVSETTTENNKIPNIVIVLAYMHTGSSYTARIIQNHPGTFYEYEPLRCLQDSSRQGKRIHFLNGTSRQVSGEVIDVGTGAEAVGNMITCNHHKLDIATLSTAYNGKVESDKRDVEDYFSCLRKKPRFRNTDTRMNHYQQLNHTRSTQSGNNATKWNMNFTSRIQGNLPKGGANQRNRPIQFVKDNMMSCLPRLTNRCKNATIRLTKYIRMTMDMAEQLLKQFETLRIIHLVRDPRAMLDSELRKNDMHVNFFPAFERRTRYMCSRMKTDLDVAEKLKKIFPDRIFTLRYEDLADDPLTIGQELFHFLDIPFTPDDKQFILSTSVEPVKDSKSRASVWRQHILSKHLDVVDRYCNELYKRLGYIRFTSISDVNNLKLPDHLKTFNLSTSTN